jgi:hypothetical protein
MVSSRSFVSRQPGSGKLQSRLISVSLAGAFDDAEVIHVEGDVDPVRDMDIIQTELRSVPVFHARRTPADFGTGSSGSRISSGLRSTLTASARSSVELLEPPTLLTRPRRRRLCVSFLACLQTSSR